MIEINIFGDFLCKTESSKITVDATLIKTLNEGHINILNYEAPVDNNGLAIRKSGPSHSQHISTIDWIVKHNFSAVSIANNHIFDYGNQGLEKTINSFKGVGIETIGGGAFEDAYKPIMYNIEGLKIAIFAFSHLEFGVLSDEWDSRYDKGVAWINHPIVDKVITDVRSLVDVIIALPHAGVEDFEQPLPEWRDRYRRLIDLGCDAVIASHPHIIQGFELYKEKPICYSIGNFYFPKEKRMPDYWYYSLMAKLYIDKDRNIKFETIPLVFRKEYIKIDVHDNYILSYCHRIQKVLANKKQYLERVNTYCVNSISIYDNLFQLSGYFNLSNCSFKKILKVIYLLFIRRKYDIVHFLNNIRCESHRYSIIRGLKIKNDIQ